MAAPLGAVELVPDYETWRRRARHLLGAGVPPAAVDWRSSEAGAQLALPGAATVGAVTQPAPRGRQRVPRRFVELAVQVACHRDAERWRLLYRLLWRLTRGGEPALLQVAVDDDVARARAMAKAVRRDRHKMKAFVRFRRSISAAGHELFLAWHRPDHLIVESVAPFFVERFHDQRWAIVTPDRSAHWDRSRLAFGPGAPAPAATRDALERLWRTYYRSIFNPARLKVRAMKAELPVRHWATLPEASMIPELVRSAPRAADELLAASGFPPAPEFFPAERSLAALAAALPACRACPLFGPASRAVFGEGPRAARLVLVGEQPGDVEDRSGRPFTGPAGRLLDRALAAAAIDRRELYLTNAVKHFKFVERGKRRIHQSPSTTEVTACLPWLEAELGELAPRLVVCLGGTAARAVIGPGVRVTRQRGTVLASRFDAPAMPTVHPASVLRITDPPSRETAFVRLAADLAAAAAFAAATDP